MTPNLELFKESFSVSSILLLGRVGCRDLMIRVVSESMCPGMVFLGRSPSVTSLPWGLKPPEASLKVPIRV